MPKDRVASLEARLKKLEDRLEGFRAETRPESLSADEIRAFRKVRDAIGSSGTTRYPGTCFTTCYLVTCYTTCYPGTCFGGTCSAGTTPRGGARKRFGDLGE